VTTTVTIQAPGYPEKRVRILITDGASNPGGGDVVEDTLLDVGQTVTRTIYDKRELLVREEQSP